MPRQKPVQLRLMQLVPAMVALLLLFLLMLATEVVVGDELSQRSLSRVHQTAGIYADQIARVLSRRASELELLSRSAAVQAEPQEPARLQAELQRLKDSSPNFSWIGWMGPDGTVQASSDGLLQGRNIAQRPVFINGQRGLWFGTLHPPVALKPEMERRGLPVPTELADLALPVFGPDGSLRGVLAAHLDGGMFDDLREQALGASYARRDMTLALVGPDLVPVLGDMPGLVVASSANGRPIFNGYPRRVASDAGEPYSMSRRPVMPVDSRLQLDWSVVAAQPLQAALAPVRELQTYVLLGGGLMALLVGGLGVLLSNRLAAPYARIFDLLATRLGSDVHKSGTGYLDAVIEHMQKQPLPVKDGTPGAALIHRVLHDTERIKTVLDLLPAPVYFIDAENRLVYRNRSAADIFGWQSDDCSGRPVLDVLRWTNPSDMKRAIMRQLTEEAGPWTFELEVERLDGARINGEWRVSKVVNADGQAVGLICKVHDLTAEREARQRLLEQTETLSAIIQASSDAVISTDESGRVELFNPAAERIFGRTAESVLGQPLERLLPERHRGDHAGHLRRFSESSTTRRRMGAGLVRGLRADGEELELEASISQVTVRGRKVLTAILRDVTERMKAERQQLRYQMELSELTHQLMEQEQQTTRKMAQILHDRLGQTITALRLSVDALATVLREGPHWPAHDRLDKIDALVKQAVEEVRQALTELRPPLLEESGLASALVNECRVRAPEAAPAALTLQIEPEVRELRWPADVEYAVFMVAREAVLNAVHHAHARRIEVSLGGDAGRIILDVTDDGVGLPNDLAYGRPGHLGMVGMRERALAIGAQLSALRGQGGGTILRLEWEASE